MVIPLIGCQCGTLSGEEADELIRRWNYFEEPKSEPISIPRYDQSFTYNAAALHAIAQLVEFGKMQVEESSAWLEVDCTKITVTVTIYEPRRLIR